LPTVAAAAKAPLKLRTDLPPGPKGRFLLGSILELRRDLLGFLTQCAREYGDVAYFRFLHMPVYVLSHPDDIERVLITDALKFVKSRDYRALAAVLGDGLVTSEGETWRRQRCLVQPAFHRENILRYARVMVDYTERAIAGWQDGGTFDVHPAMMGLTLEIVSECLFGADVRPQSGNVGEALQVVMENFSDYARMALVLPRWLALPRMSKMGQAVRRLNAALYSILHERRAARNGKHPSHGSGNGIANPAGTAAGSGGGNASADAPADLLGLLLQAQDESGGAMDDRQVRDEAMTLFLAGHETTALALSWTWYLLGANPDVEQKLAEELDQVLAGRAPTPEDLPRLRYTDMVLKESMRLYPPAWAIGREAREPFQAGEFLVRAGATVFFSQWITHRDPRFFPGPERFDPERWRDDPIRRGALPRFAYFPFGGGPRVCVGAGFAQMEAALILATIAQRFRLSLVPGQSIPLLPSVTLRPRHGVRVTAHRRK
jgi:cytochrome P450